MWIEQFGGIDVIVFYVFCAVSAVIVILSLANIITGCCVTGYSGASSIDFNIAFGSIMLAYTVLVRGVDTTWLTWGNLEIICQFYPAALLVGLTMFIGGLMVKSWGILLYNKYNNDKKPLAEEWKPNMWIWFLLIIIAGVSVAWCVVYTPHLDPPQPAGDGMLQNSTATYMCINDHEFEWKVSTSVWHAFLLLLAVIAIIPNCSVVKSAEATILSVVTINTLFSVVAGVCINFLYKTGDATVMYAIIGGLMLWLCLFAVIMLLASKILGNRRSSKGMSDQGDNYDTINSDKGQRAPGARNDGYLEPQEGGGDNFNY